MYYILKIKNIGRQSWFFEDDLLKVKEIRKIKIKKLYETHRN